MRSHSSAKAAELLDDSVTALSFAPRSNALEGILVLVVTDLKGFTAMVERLGDQTARMLMRRHNGILRDCLRRRGGHEVAHTGDGIIAAFRSVASALHCAQEIQHALHSHFSVRGVDPLQARIGVHAGEPLPEDGRLFGSCVNVAVRVCNLARAEHVLVTGVVKQLAQGRDFDFVASQTVQLDGLHSEVEVHELLCGLQVA